MIVDEDDPFGAQPAQVGQPIDIRPILPEPEEFPLAALPPYITDAINAIVDIVQVPVPLAAQSVLAACSLVAQTRIEVEMPTREVVPAALFLFTVAASGDRKTSADKLALGAIYDRERELRRAYEPRHQKFLVDKAAYDASVAKAKRDGGKDRDKVREYIEACGNPPSAPALPMLLVEEPTVEGVVKLLDEAYPSIGLFSDEGAKFLGGYSMQAEREAATGAALSQLWDGKPIKRVRGTDVTKILDGRRLAVHLMVQPGVAAKLFGNKALRDQGMMSRMLVAFPKSLKGQRLWREPLPESWQALEKYNTRLGNLLHDVFSHMNPETRELEFATVTLQPSARALWIAFSDSLERQQGVDGPLHAVADLASKMAQHALRMAAVISFFSGSNHVIREGISEAAMSAGIRLGEFYLSEALRLFNSGAVSDDADNAAALIEFLRKEKLSTVGRRWMSQHCPNHIRPAEPFGRAVTLLIDNGHLVEVKGGVKFRARGKDHTGQVGYTIVYPEADR